MPVSPEPRRLVHARAHAHVEALLHTLDLQLGRALKSQEAKQIHDLRVATRRFTQALKIFEAYLGDTKAILVRCRSLMKMTGKVRDLDIAMKILRDEHGTDAADVLAGIERERDQRAKELHRSIAQKNGRIAIPVSNKPASATEVHDAIVKAGKRLFR